MIRITEKDTHILDLVALPPDAWGDLELDAVDAIKLAGGLHAAGLESLRVVAQELGIDLPAPRPGASSVIAFANSLCEEIRLRRDPPAFVMPEVA
ncbi:MAG: hypothetical protein K2Z25_15355 [Beijerinckiaceae bacterium]|nr:hypothetical protein [Beijerinckiaceae bacterium]